MKDHIKSLPFFAVILVMLAGCASVAISAFRTEQITTDAVFTAYIGWTNYLAKASPTPELLRSSNDVRMARLEYAALATTAHTIIAEYQTNAAVKPQVDAILNTMADKKSNVVWMIESAKIQPLK